MRDHEPVFVEEFNGLYLRGDGFPCPIDHSPEFVNYKFNQSGFQTRDGIDIFLATTSVLKYYYYPDAGAGDGYLVLKSDNKIYHLVGAIGAFVSFTVSNAIAGMTDFAFVSINGRAFISPTLNTNLSGLTGEFVYVYDGNQTTMMRKAAGTAPTTAEGALVPVNSATAGSVEAGVHVFGVVYETNSGFLTQIGPTILPTLTATGGKKVDLSAIPIFGGGGGTLITKRHIVASKLILAATYNAAPDPKAYQLFFVPNGVIANNTATTLTIDFFDSQLIEDASHLLDLLSEIPAVGGLSTYHGRMIGWDTATNINEVLVSYADEPEAFDSVTGLLLVPKEGIGITRAQQYRDILYVFKNIKTYAFNDNGDVPTSWSSMVVDDGLGAGKEGVANVGTYGGINTEALILMNEQGVSLFTGLFNKPELTFKIRDYWLSLNRADIRTGKMAAYIDAINQLLYICNPAANMVIVGDFANGLHAETIRWSQWTFGLSPATIGLFDKDNKLVMGSATGLHYVNVSSTHDVINGTGSVKIPNPTYSTALVNNSDGTRPMDDENIYHYGGTRIRITGSGNVILTLKGLDNIVTSVLATLALGGSAGKEKVVLANMMNQRARLVLQTTAIDETVSVNQIILYVKPIYMSYPG